MSTLVVLQQLCVRLMHPTQLLPCHGSANIADPTIVRLFSQQVHASTLRSARCEFLVDVL